MRVLLVDDEAPARSRLRQMLSGEPDVEVVGECANGQQAVAAIRQHRPDLVFLDVQMPRLDGMEVCRELGDDALPLVIFVTAYNQYAVQAFELHAVDYLLKPFDQERFHRALNHARGQMGRGMDRELNERLLAALRDARSHETRSDRLAFRSEGRVFFLRADEIDWVEAEGNYVRLHVGTTTHLLRETLSSMETQLPADRFLRISRSTLVNLDRVREVQPLFYGDHVVILKDGTQLTLTRNYREKLEALLTRPPR